jgi:ADP-heptose:LPS heptosyltransferase
VPFPSSRPFRKKTNWLIALAVEAAGPVLRLRARARTGPPSKPAQWRKALILGDNHIGDLLYRSASLERLKAGLPECEFHYLAAPGSSDVLQGNPALAAIHPWLRSDSPLDMTPEHFAALKAMQFDAALSTNCIKYWPELLLALRLGIPNRVAYEYKGFSGWSTRPIPIRYPQPYPVYFRNYVAALTGQKPDWPLRPVIHATERDRLDADALWASLDRGKPAIACFPTGRQPVGIWPAAHFAETLRALRQKSNVHVLLCGAAGDEPILSGLNKQFGLEADIVAGSLGVRALSCFLRRCALVLAADSGPRHIANAAGIPVFFVRNVNSNAIETGVYVDTETDLCGPPHDGDRGDAVALLAAIKPENAAALLASKLAM